MMWNVQNTICKSFREKVRFNERYKHIIYPLHCITQTIRYYFYFDSSRNLNFHSLIYSHIPSKENTNEMDVDKDQKKKVFIYHRD